MLQEGQSLHPSPRSDPSRSDDRIDNYSAFDADKIIWCWVGRWRLWSTMDGDKGGVERGAVLFRRQDDE